jgi:hypothetical protein
MTKRQALALEERFGGRFIGDRLDWVDVTTFNSGPELLLNTSRCEYCGQPAPDAQCASCGARSLRDGE